MSKWEELRQSVSGSSLENYCTYVAKLYGLASLELKELETISLEDHTNIAQIDARLDDLEQLVETVGLVGDFYRCRDVLNDFGLLMDGHYEALVKGEKSVFQMPSLGEIMNALSPKDIDIYLDMKKRRWDPHLQMTPIGLDWNVVLRKLSNNSVNNKVDERLLGDQVVYEPETYQVDGIGPRPPRNRKPIAAGPLGTTNLLAPQARLFARGGKTKDQLVEENAGWLIDIVPLCELMPADPDILPDPTKNEIQNAEQVRRFDQKWRSKGYNGLGLESYTMAALIALKKYRRELDKTSGFTDESRLTVITETALTDPYNIIIGLRDVSVLKVHPLPAGKRFKASRFRPSWRIRTPGR